MRVSWQMAKNFEFGQPYHEAAEIKGECPRANIERHLADCVYTV